MSLPRNNVDHCEMSRAVLFLLALLLTTSSTNSWQPTCNGSSYELETRHVETLLFPDNPIDEYDVTHLSCRTPKTLNEMCSRKPDLEVICVNTPTERTSSYQYECETESKYSKYMNLPQCFVCCPELKSYKTHQERNAIDTLDDINTGMTAITNTILLYDLAVHKVPENLFNFALTLKVKHELYFVLRNIYELKVLQSRDGNINIDNYKALLCWLRIIRGTFTVVSIKLNHVKYHDVMLDSKIRSLKIAIRVALLPLRGVLCGINVINTITQIKSGKAKLINVYVVVSSCLRTAKQWYNYVNLIQYADGSNLI